ncbi:unnamed protein product [Peronospora belbahrii]|uniref:PH domain-containing protein n=1 Tax=Peronospora belbahrii TaxID=622444 RepID=A0AAU9LG38_9STRA|nr:unnamed protein product [Peronospora belbahrii]
MTLTLTRTNLVPLCTISSRSNDRNIYFHNEGINIFQDPKLLTRKVALVGVLYVPENAQDDGLAAESDRGLFLSPITAISAADKDVGMLLLVLRNVSLVNEPFWGLLLFILSSHVVVIKAGAITTASFQETLPFLEDFTHLKVCDMIVDGERNAFLLKELAPGITWGAIDLKIKDMNGCDSPSAYFEQQLVAGSTDAQLLLSSFVSVRDCVVLKSSSFQTPRDPYTSPKLLTHVADRLVCKSFFGRYMNGPMLMRLIRLLAHAVTSPNKTPLVLQHMVMNVVAVHWQELVQQAFKAYCDVMHASLAVYEPAPITAEYLVDVTERKLKANESNNLHVAVVDARQESYSVFDEFGNLKQHQVVEEDELAVHSATIFHDFLRTVGVARVEARARLCRNVAVGGLGDIREDAEAAEAELLKEASAVQTPEQMLTRCTASIGHYSVALKYSNISSEAMPVNNAVLDTVHADGLDEVNALLKPFLVDMQGPLPSSPELACSLEFRVGKKNLWAKLARIRRRFDRANEVSSAIFCGELLRYLHSVVLRKNETDAEQQQQSRDRAVSSIMLVSKKSERGPVSLTRVPLELLTYKNNLEAMVSQYNFVARGPQAATVLAGFLHGPVRNQLQHLTQQEYGRFSAACEEKKNRIKQLGKALENNERQVHHIEKANAEWGRQERKAVAEIENTHTKQLSSLQDAIRRAEAHIKRALADQQALYQSTMEATRHTIDTVDKVADKGRVVSGYLERYEKGHVFSSRWRQYFYVLNHDMLTCYKSKSEYEERGPVFEQPISVNGYSVVRSRTDELKIKLVPPGAGSRMLRFRAPASVGRETWIKRFTEATQFISR